MKPVLFCDFDGVINQFPFKYARETDGSHNVVLEYNGQTSYGFLREEFDNEKFFEHTNFVMLETYKGTFPISYSSEMVERLRNLILSDKVEFIWLTTWRDEAVRLLNPMFDFPDNLTFLHWQSRMSDYNHAGKSHAVMDYFEEDPTRLGRKMVWLDDVATRDFKTWDDKTGFIENKRAEMTGYNSSVKVFPENKLIMLTDEFFGISKAGMSAIENFVS